MNIISIYAVTVGGMFASLFLLSLFPYFTRLARTTVVFISKHITFPFLLRRHRHVGPWTRGTVFIHTLYGAINIFCLCFHALSSVDAARRAGTLAAVNMIVLYVTGDLSGYPDVLSISRRSCQQIHRATAWMVASLLILHIILTVTTQEGFSLQKSGDLFALIVSS